MLTRPSMFKSFNQSGSVLLEALIGLLIFSVGILGIAGMQATAIRSVSDAQYRIEASNLASRAISEIRTSYATIGSYTSSTTYSSWQADVNALLPTTVNPTVTLVGGGNSWVATVTINWQAPGDPDTHTFTTVSTLDRNPT